MVGHRELDAGGRVARGGDDLGVHDADDSCLVPGCYWEAKGGRLCLRDEKSDAT